VTPISFKRHRFPADVIRHAVWVYFRFSLSFRDVEELLEQRGIDVSYETIQCWTIKFGPQIAKRLKRRRPGPSPRWHLDEMVCWIGGRRMYLWRAVDDEGEVLGTSVERRRDARTATSFLQKLVRDQAVRPQAIVTDGLGSYVSAVNALDLQALHSPGRLRENNRVENSHLPIRKQERHIQLLTHAVDREILGEHAGDLRLQLQVPARPRRQPGRVPSLSLALVVGGWGDRQDLADQLDPIDDRGDRPRTRSSLEPAVELRLGKIRGRLAQDLVGLAQFTVLTLQRLHPLGHVAWDTRPLAGIDLRLLHPLMQGLRHAADLLGDRHHSRPARRMIPFVIHHHPNRTLANLR
jgi:putative transposase